MRGNNGVSMITLIITIIVIIILAAIAFIGFDDATRGAQFAKFEQEFGDYTINFKLNTAGKIKEKNSTIGNVLTIAQINYEAATGITTQKGHIIPKGEEFNDLAVALTTAFSDQTLLVVEEKDADGNIMKRATQCYPITDSNVKGYKNDHDFYGDNLGTEKHYVTQNGDVFTVPGYPRIVDSENRMYVTTELYYLTDDSYSNIATVSTSTPGSETIINEDVSDTNELADIKVGHYVSYTPDTSTSVKWRVWKVNGNEVVIMPISPVGTLKLGVSENIDECLNDYNTAVSRIEKLCDNYKSSVLGISELDIRSLTLEDLEDKNISTLATTKLSYTGGIGFGNTKTFTSGDYFGARYDGSKNNISSVFIEASTSNPVTLKQTLYISSTPEWKNLPNLTDTYGTLLGETYGWLPSLGIYCTSSRAQFVVYVANNAGVNAYNLFYSNGTTNTRTVGVRPLISLKTSLLGVSEENPGDGSSGAPWNIVKK